MSRPPRVLARLRTAVAALLLLAVVALAAGTSGASAAALPLGPVTRPWASTSTGCATGTAVVTPAARTDASAVAVTGLDVSRCPGSARLEVSVVTSAGAVRTLVGTVDTRAAVPTGTPLTVTDGGAAAVRVDGWVRPATLVAPVVPGDDAVVEGVDGIVITDRRWTVVDDRQVCVTVTFRATSYTPVQWRLQVVTQAAPWYGDTALDHYVLEADNWNARMLRNTPTPGALQIGGQWTPLGTLEYVSANPRSLYPSERTVTFCNRQLPQQPDVPSAYEVTVTQTRWDAPASGQVNVQVCYAVVVRGNGTSPFNVGWTARVDLAAAVDHVRSYSEGPYRLSVSLSGSQRTYVQSGTVLTLQAGPYGVLKGTETLETAVCVSRW